MDGSPPDPPGPPPALAALRSLVDLAPARLRAIPPERTGARPGPGRWSPREELGHLVDSAFNNHQRVVRTQLEDRPALPGYDGDRWVALHLYQERDWRELIEVWEAGNRQLLAAAESAPQAAWSRACTIGSSAPLTLRFVLEDYLRHLLHHLRHIGIEA